MAKDCWTGVDPGLFEFDIERELYAGIVRLELENWRCGFARRSQLVVCRRAGCLRCKLLREMMTEEERGTLTLIDAERAGQIFRDQTGPPPEVSMLTSRQQSANVYPLPERNQGD